MNEENPFFKDLDKLISLFKKLREKTMKENIPGFDNQFFQSFDMIVENYHLIKNQISEDYIKQLGIPLKQMIQNMIQQLQEELGEEITTKPEMADTLKEIDEMLKKPDLSGSEIDNLLDKRQTLKTEPNPDKISNNSDNELIN